MQPCESFHLGKFCFILLLQVCSITPLLAQQPKLLGDAYVHQNILCITTNTVQSTGRAFYDKAIPICQSTTTPGAFNTTFVFSIKNYTSTRGEGLAFLISGQLSGPPRDSYGKWLGLFDEAANKNPGNRLVAVEFDTVKSFGEEPSVTHVGVDVNQIESQVSPTLEVEVAGRVNLLDPFENVSVWIDYLNRSMSVYVNRNSLEKPQAPVVVRQPVDLCQSAAAQSGVVYVGFSASTGDSSKDVHMIHSWNFSSTSSVTFSFPLFEGGNTSDSPVNRSSRKSSKNNSILVASLVTVFGVLLLLSCYCATILLRKRLRRCFSSEADVRLREDLPIMPSEFSHSELKAATGNFSKSNILGEGGFGKVYVGTLTSDKSSIAVKRISEDSKQGEREFLAEVQIITKLSHRNLVQLRGWCCRTKELLLVYEYMPNGSLDKALYGNAAATRLDWAKRYEIVSGLASALLYLHEECEQRVVHRDIKPSNIMLDVDFNARLGDFGLARLVDRNRDARTTTVAGTFGYLAPELNVTLKSTPASDVYSFGVVVLEVACGRKPFQATSDKTLVEWVWELHREGRVVEAADQRLEWRFDMAEMERVLMIGLSCSEPNVKDRPSMLQVVNTLKGNLDPPVLSRSVKAEDTYPSIERSTFSFSDSRFPVNFMASSAP